MAKYLRKVSGWNPTVLTVDRVFSRRDPALLEEIPSGTGIHRTWTIEPAEMFQRLHREMLRSVGTGTPGPSGIRDLLDRARRKAYSWLMEIFSIPDEQVFWNLSVIWHGLKIIRRESIRAVLVTSPPWSLQISGYALKKITGVRWIADFRDPWTDIRRKNRPAAIDAMERWLEKKLLSYADLVLSTSDTYTEDLRRKYPEMKGEKFQTLHNGYDEDKFRCLAQVGSSTFTIAHLGSLYSQFNPDALFEALAEWLSNRDEALGNIELLFIGEITEDTRESLEKRGLLGITRITGYIPHEEAIQRCHQADVLLLALGTNPAMPKGWLPSKLFEYLAVNRPILAYVAEGEAASMVRRINKGFVVTREDKAAVGKILSDLYESKQKHPDHAIPWANDEEALEKLQQHFLMGRLGALLDSLDT